ncbi:O-antigen ligase family protein [Candidatus Jorgensenbacteria bacterium]|nr:O-antigen ligase family protein [Candidatus Jorgensenbacteria bacterium]
MFREQFLLKAIKSLLYAALLLPLLYNRSFIYPFITLKVFTFQSLVEILFAFWLVLIIFYPTYRPRWTPLRISLSVLLFVTAIGSFLNPDVHRALWSTQDRMIGLITLIHFAVFFIVLSSISHSINWRRYLGISLAVSSIIAIITVAVVARIIPYQTFLVYEIQRPGTFFGNAAFLASYLIFHVFIGGWFLINSLGKKNQFFSVLFGIAIVFNSVALFVTKTRGAIVGLFLGVIAFLAYSSRNGFGDEPTSWFEHRKKMIRKISTVVLCLILGMSVFFVFTRQLPFWKSVPGLDRFANLESVRAEVGPRLIAWRISWQSFLDRPFFGYGFDHFKYAVDRHFDPKLLRYSFSETYFDKPHNVFFEYLVNGGIIGFIAYLGFLAALFYTLIRSNLTASSKGIFMGVIVAYLGQNFFIFDTFGSYLLLFVLAAFIDGHYYRASEVLNSSVPSAPMRMDGKIIATIIIVLSLVPVYFINIRAVYANNRQYWGLNYFLNRDANRALESYEQALTTANPYLDYTRKDFAVVLSDIYAQDIEVPDVEKVAAKAMEGLANAIVNHPLDYFLRLTLADTASAFHSFDPNYLKLAEEQIVKASELSPNRQEVFYTLSRLKVVQGKLDEAKNLMEKAVSIDSEAGDPHFYYGLVLLQSGERDKGFREIDRAKELRRQPKTAFEARMLANYYAEAEKYMDAIKWYEWTVRENNYDLDSWLKLAIVYFYTNQYDKAKEAFRLVLEAKPEFRQSPNFQLVEPMIEKLGL